VPLRTVIPKTLSMQRFLRAQGYGISYGDQVVVASLRETRSFNLTQKLNQAKEMFPWVLIIASFAISESEKYLNVRVFQTSRMDEVVALCQSLMKEFELADVEVRLVEENSTSMARIEQKK